MSIPKYLQGIISNQDEKGMFICRHDRILMSCLTCMTDAVQRYDSAIHDDLDHVNKFKITKSSGESLPEGEPYFVLRAQDKLAGTAMQAYLNVMLDVRYTGEAIEHMQEHILEFQAWQPKKNPD